MVVTRGATRVHRIRLIGGLHTFFRFAADAAKPCAKSVLEAFTFAQKAPLSRGQLAQAYPP